jgi:hypothetical protein
MTFQDGQKQGMSVVDAATYADTWVAETNPSTRTMDRSYFMSQKSTVYAMFNLFAGWMHKHQNEVLFNHLGYQKGKISFGQLSTFVITDMLLSSILGSVIINGLRGKTPEKEEVLTDIIAYNTAGIPIIGEIVTNLSRQATGQRAFKAGDSPVSMVWEMAQRVPTDFFTAASEKDAKKAAWALAEGWSFLYKIPATRIYEDLMEGWRQAQQTGWPGLLVSPDPERKQR